MPAFNPPNPYGSYFDFGHPEATAMASFFPQAAGYLSGNAMSLMGQGSGGFNPSTIEYAAQRNRDMMNNNFMAHVLRTDARAAMVGDRALNSMFASEDQRKAFLSRVGAGNATEVMSFLMNMPGISSYIGGSQRSLGIGAMAVAGGMSMNGIGGFGGGWMQHETATAVYNMVNRRFLGPGGASNLSMTSGLNRDQLGAVMTMGAAQGAFGGLDMGTLSSQAGKASFTVNQGTLDKIANFTKSAAKAISSLIDVYGSQDVSQLLQKAQQITGLDLSRLGNADAMANRIQTLRNTAITSGLDIQTVLDTTAGATQMSMALGAKAPVAGSIGANAMTQGAMLFRHNQANSGVFYMATPSLTESVAGAARDATAMTQDPLGSRRAAVELLMQNYNVSSAEREAIRQRMAAISPQGAGALDRFGLERFGQHLPTLIRSMGGPDALMNQIEDKDAVLSQNASDLHRRQETLMRKSLRRLFNQNGYPGSVDDMMSLVSNLQVNTISGLLKSAGGSGVLDMNRILEGDVVGMGAGKGDFAAAAQRLGQVPGIGGLYQTFQQSVAGDRLTSQYINNGTLAVEEAKRLQNAPLMKEALRGQLSGGFSEGLWQNLAGTDKGSMMALLTSRHPGRVAGADPSKEIRFNKDAWFEGDQLNDAVGFRQMLVNLTDLHHVPGGVNALMALDPILAGHPDKIPRDREQLRKLGLNIFDPFTFNRAFKDLTMARKESGATAFAATSDVDAMNVAGIQANNLANLLEKKQPGLAHQFGLMSEELLNPDSKLSGSQRGREMDLVRRMALRWETVSAVGVNKLQTMFRADPGFTQDLSNMLQNVILQESDSTNKIPDKKKLAEAQAKYKELGVPAETGMQLTGTLELIGNSLQLKGKMKDRK